jgi:hypothetical protein
MELEFGIGEVTIEPVMDWNIDSLKQAAELWERLKTISYVERKADDFILLDLGSDEIEQFLSQGAFDAIDAIIIQAITAAKVHGAGDIKVWKLE